MGLLSESRIKRIMGLLGFRNNFIRFHILVIVLLPWYFNCLFKAAFTQNAFRRSRLQR